MPFYNSINNPNNFVISFTQNPCNDFGVFARGYYHAAAKLAEDIISRPHFPDYEAYPVVFLYRHAFELYLKNIVYKAALLSVFRHMNDIDASLYNRHELIPLSQRAMDVLNRLFPDDESLKQFTNRVLQIAVGFSELDPGSYSYRYPINPQGNYSTKYHQVANLEAIHRIMSELLEGLDSIDFGLDIETYKAQEIYEILEQLEQDMLGVDE